METIFEIIKHLLSMRAGWVVLEIILLALMLLILGLCKSAAMADEMARGFLCRKSATKKQKFTAGLLDTSGQSSNGTKESSRNLKTGKPLKSQAADREKDLIQWKKHRQIRRMKPKGI